MDRLGLQEIKKLNLLNVDHIPLAPGRKKTLKNTADSHEKVNFPPFQHWNFNDQDELICVGKSHWKGTIDTGKFSKDHGRITENLGKMFIKLSERYAQRSNWRGYTYNEEMRGQAILQLSQIGLQFDESKSENPFAYYTAAVTNSFTRVLNIEKKNLFGIYLHISVRKYEPNKINELLMKISDLLKGLNIEMEAGIKEDTLVEDHALIFIAYNKKEGENEIK